LVFRGDLAELRNALGDHCTLLDSEEGELDRVKLHIGAEQSVREIIAVANDLVEIRSFQEMIPSMNDIFIRAVAGKL
jgi:ABC-2 type transport system ATP-binding protein